MESFTITTLPLIPKHHHVVEADTKIKIKARLSNVTVDIDAVKVAVRGGGQCAEHTVRTRRGGLRRQGAA